MEIHSLWFDRDKTNTSQLQGSAKVATLIIQYKITISDLTILLKYHSKQEPIKNLGIIKDLSKSSSPSQIHQTPHLIWIYIGLKLEGCGS